MTKRIEFILILIFLSPLTFASEIKSEIDYLLKHITEIEGTFIRNDKEHTPKEAVKHIQKKYNYFKKKITTTEEFIELSATKSTSSGKIYYIKTEGKKVPSKEYLLEILSKYREAHKSKTEN